MLKLKYNTSKLIAHIKMCKIYFSSYIIIKILFLNKQRTNCSISRYRIYTHQNDNMMYLIENRTDKIPKYFEKYINFLWTTSK